jgi:hypothetical protein
MEAERSFRSSKKPISDPALSQIIQYALSHPIFEFHFSIILPFTFHKKKDHVSQKTKHTEQVFAYSNLYVL